MTGQIPTLFFGESVDRYQYEHLRPKGKFPKRRPTHVQGRRPSRGWHPKRVRIYTSKTDIILFVHIIETILTVLIGRFVDIRKTV